MSPWGLFLLFAKTALLTFGGGYAMVPLFQNEIVTRHTLLSAADFANLVALAQVTPGPIGFNAATYVGMTCGGWTGSVVASLGVIVPTFLVAFVVAVFLKRAAGADWMKTMMKGIRPCVIGIIAAAVFFFADTSVFTAPFAAFLRGGSFGVCWQGAVIFGTVVFVRWKWKKPNPVWSLVLSAALGWLLFLPVG